MKQRPRKYCYEYPRPMVTVDCVILKRRPRLEVLLVRRDRAPFKGLWALPGGFIQMNETLEQSARRELHEETGLRVRRLKQLATFGDPGRDPRGRTITVVFMGDAGARATPKAGDDAREAAWRPLARLPKLAADHRKILALVRKRPDLW